MSRLMDSGEKFERIVELVQEYVVADDDKVANFLDGGEEGWDCGDEEQSLYLNSEPAREIADWVIAGLS